MTQENQTNPPRFTEADVDIVARGMWLDNNDRGGWNTHAGEFDKFIYRSNASAALRALTQTRVLVPVKVTWPMAHAMAKHAETWRERAHIDWAQDLMDAAIAAHLTLKDSP